MSQGVAMHILLLKLKTEIDSLQYTTHLCGVTMAYLGYDGKSREYRGRSIGVRDRQPLRPVPALLRLIHVFGKCLIGL